MTTPHLSEQEIYSLERPVQNLLIYYALTSLLLGPFFFLLLLPLYFRYITLRYRFDEEGVSMRWGIFFRRETNLTYSRIQDIHLMSNFLERWLGLARIKIQTASGSSQAEMTIEGIEAFEDLRNFLYTRMRGSRSEARPSRGSAGGGGELSSENLTELTHTLREVARELRALRQTGGGPAGGVGR
jgi:putative membrane protein